MKKLLCGSLLVLLCGCATNSKMDPLLVRIGVGTTTGYALTKNPKAVKYIEAVTPVICSAAAGTNLAPAQIVSLIQLSNADALKTPEGILIVNGALMLYTGIYSSYGTDTLKNSPELRGYLQATCDGIKDGLGQVHPDTITAGKDLTPPDERWPIVQ